MNYLIRTNKENSTEGCILCVSQTGDIHTIPTIELEWDDNKRNVSCIPDGIYSYRKDYSSNKRRDVLELVDVPNRADIQIHRASSTSQLKGCIGVSADAEVLLFSIMGDTGVLCVKTI